MAEQPPLHFVFYIAAPPDKVWQAFLSPESNRIIFSCDFEAGLEPNAPIHWFGPGPDGKPVDYVHGTILEADPPRLLRYTFAIGPSDKFSRVTLELTPETEATKVSLTHDQWAPDDTNHSYSTDGWPRILSRLKTLIETGKTFKPH